jgi:hypothetical protein
VTSNKHTSRAPVGSIAHARPSATNVAVCFAVGRRSSQPSGSGSPEANIVLGDGDGAAVAVIAGEGAPVGRDSTGSDVVHDASAATAHAAAIDLVHRPRTMTPRRPYTR